MYVCTYVCMYICTYVYHLVFKRCSCSWRVLLSYAFLCFLDLNAFTAHAFGVILSHASSLHCFCRNNFFSVIVFHVFCFYMKNRYTKKRKWKTWLVALTVFLYSFFLLCPCILHLLHNSCAQFFLHGGVNTNASFFGSKNASKKSKYNF